LLKAVQPALTFFYRILDIYIALTIFAQKNIAKLVNINKIKIKIACIVAIKAFLIGIVLKKYAGIPTIANKPARNVANLGSGIFRLLMSALHHKKQRIDVTITWHA